MKDKEKDSEENPENNFELEQIDFDAFLFKFMLNQNLQTEEAFEWQKEGILKNLISPRDHD